MKISGTFSMVVRCPETSALGVCVSTAVPAVGNRVPHVEAGIGAIATQAKTNITYGINGLKPLRKGLSPQRALETMLKKDRERVKTSHYHRQKRKNGGFHWLCNTIVTFL